MKILLAQKRHLNQISKLLSEEHFPSLKEARIRASKKIKSRECFVATNQKNIFGVFIYARDYSHHANYLEDIVVSKSHRKRGIGKKLLLKYIQISKKEQPKRQKFILSSTVITNKASINMHLSCGFVKLGKIKKLHYGKDEIIFGYKIR